MLSILYSFQGEFFWQKCFLFNTFKIHLVALAIYGHNIKIIINKLLHWTYLYIVKKLQSEGGKPFKAVNVIWQMPFKWMKFCDVCIINET